MATALTNHAVYLHVPGQIRLDSQAQKLGLSHHLKLFASDLKNWGIRRQ